MKHFNPLCRITKITPLFIIICFAHSIAQNYWAKTYGGANEEALMAITTIRENRIGVAGWTKSFGAGYEDILFFVIDNDGNIVFEKTYGESQMDEAFTLSSTFDGGALIGGTVQYVGFGSSDISLIRLDSIGNTIWKVCVGNVDDDAIASVAKTPDDGFIVVGYSHPPTRPGFNITIFKVSSDGKLLWQKILQTDSVAYDFARKVIRLKNGNYLVMGIATAFSQNQQSAVLLIELTEDGKIVSGNFVHSDIFRLSPLGIEELEDGFIIMGNILSPSSMEQFPFILKLSKNYVPIWSKKILTLSGDGPGNLYDMIRTSKGYLYTCGNNNTNKPWLVKFDSSGKLLLTKSFSSNLFSSVFPYCYSLTETSDGGLALGGWLYDNNIGTSDIFIFKVDSLGNLPKGEIWNETFDCKIDGFSIQVDSLSIDTAEYKLYTQESPLLENTSQLQVVDILTLDVSVDAEKSKFYLEITQLPENETLWLNIKSESEMRIEIDIYDVFGRIVRRFPLNLSVGNHHREIDLIDLPKGVYFLRENISYKVYKFTK